MPHRSLYRSFHCLIPLLLTATSAMADCTCRAGGRDYKLGERVCLSGRAAVCGMDQNVSSWISVNEPCVVSARPAPRQVAMTSLRRN